MSKLDNYNKIVKVMVMVEILLLIPLALALEKLDSTLHGQHMVLLQFVKYAHTRVFPVNIGRIAGMIVVHAEKKHGK